MDFLKSAVASAIAKGPLANYTLLERIDLDESIWTLNNATKRDDGSKCSIFTFDLYTNRSRAPIARNALRKCRTLRHPGVIKVLDTVETDAQLCIITERLTPLSQQIRRNTLSEEAIKWGLWNIAKTVAFINNEAASVHACIRLSSVFTGESGEWKLGGFEVLSALNDDEAMVHAHTGLVPNYNRILSPEVTRSGWGTYKQNPWAAVDAYGFATLVSDIYGASGSAPAQPSELRGFPPSMQQQYKRLLNINPKARLPVAGFLEQGRKPGGYFRNPLISITESLDSLGLKSEGERAEFLDEIQESADQFPDEFLHHRILPEMLKSVEFGGGGPKVFGLVLQIAAKLGEDEYERQVVPVIVRLFASPDRALRVCLLDALPAMIDHLPKGILNDRIFPCITTGFSDIAPLVREQTVKSVLTIIPKLSERTVNNELLKHLAKTANDAEPGIRTNTTICLGKIAKYLGPGTRTKVLVAAFTRSLKDPFVHARNAAVLALGATVDMFSEDDCANKLLPAICPSLMDKEKVVREQASKIVDSYISKIRKAAQSMPDSALPPPSANPTSTANGGPRIGTAANDSSWAGWAISSFTNKLSAADGTIEPNAKVAVNGTASSTPSNPLSRSSTPSNALRPTSTTRPAAMMRQTTDTTRLAQSFAKPELAIENDGWGDLDDGNADDGWGTMAGDGEDTWDAGGAGRSSTTSERSSLTTSNAATRTSSTTNYDDNGEPDFAGWLKAQQSTKIRKAPLPKGLASGTKPAAANSSITTTRPIAAAKPAPIVAAKKANAPTSKPSPAALTQTEDDDWGDAWA